MKRVITVEATHGISKRDWLCDKMKMRVEMTCNDGRDYTEAQVEDVKNKLVNHLMSEHRFNFSEIKIDG